MWSSKRDLSRQNGLVIQDSAVHRKQEVQSGVDEAALKTHSAVLIPTG